MDEISGTSMSVHGEWYLRFVGGEGVMVPIAGPKEVLDDLRDNVIVWITGYMSKSHLGCPLKVHAKMVRSGPK